MDYRVSIPFTIKGDRLSRGATIGPEIEQAKNFRALLGDGYIERKYDRVTGDEHVDGCYIALQHFTGQGHDYKPGDFVDLREKDWRNEIKLVNTGYLKYANEHDLANHEGLGPSTLTLSTKPESAGPPTRLPAKLWKDEKWLRREYLVNKKSIPEMEEIAGCARSTLWAALKKAGIETRPRGRPKGG